MNDDWTLAALKEYMESTLEEREKRWLTVEANVSRRLAALEALSRQILEEQRSLLGRHEFEALEKRYEERHEKLEIAVSLIQARLVPVFWVGAAMAVALIGTFISHVVTGTP